MDKKLLASRLEEVEAVSGSGTALVSLYISAGTNISSEKRRISQEKSEAANIKSKKNRKNVKKAINRVGEILKKYKQTPENGLVIFVGVSEDGTEEFVFDELPQQLDHSDYTCDSRFHTDPLRNMISPDQTIGLLIIERGGAVIGELRGTSIKVHYDEDSQVQSQHNAGGFSNRRFDRVIEEEKEEYFASVREKISELFINTNHQPTVDGFVIGGSTITLDNFISDGFLPDPLKDILIGKYSIDIANAENLEELVNKAKTDIDSVAQQEEREHMERFFKALHSDSADVHATYGGEMVEKALEYGAVKTLLISENKDNQTINDYKNKVESQGGDIVVISDDFSEGTQFWKGFNGLGAILRYPIN